ncbi:MAG TPA: hypothetical protein VGY76_09485 [Solirubrobacteraceae bacterium]|nr:hypothetical protein [Solirubrobacteraceae bacterium]
MGGFAHGAASAGEKAAWSRGIARGPRSAIPTRAIRRALAPTLTLLAALACCASPAPATFTPFTLASADPRQGLEADYAYDPAISADGRYVAFSGSLASLPGVYREDRVTGALELVAAGLHTGAPSISAEGRYVSFTTDDNPATGAPSGPEACSSVYVRDMQNRPALEPAQPISTKPQPWEPESSLPAAKRAFTLASARNGSEESLTYQPLAPGEGPGCGAATAARVALSADGRKLAFTVLSRSDLTGACEMAGEPPKLTCPAGPDQVVVRALDAKTTTLVSATLASRGGKPEAVPLGAALTGPTFAGPLNLAIGGSTELAVGASTAAISADGSTVAWMGIEIPQQVPLDHPPLTGGPHARGYAEPLWRRIADGPDAPTRRVLAGDDPSAPECPPACPGGLDLEWDTQGLSPQEYTGAAPEYGSYTSQAGQATGFAAGAGLGYPLTAVTPQLSADGMQVALLSTQPDFGHDPEFGLFNQSRPPPANAFVVNMTPGLTRAQAIQRLTDWASLDFENPQLTSPVTNIALSPDGTRVAFTTQRIAFPLAPPALITPTLSQAGVTQLYEVNLHAGTLAMVSFGYDGQPANERVIATAFSGDGHTLALASGATNLVYGVVNEGSGVFVTEEVHSPAAPGQQSIGPPPAGPTAAIPWSLSATATPSPDGTLVLYASVPGAGRLSASAVTALAGRGGQTRKSKTVKRRAAMARRRGPKHTRKARGPGTNASTRIAYAAASAGGPEVLELHLVPAARWYPLLQRSRSGLYTTITVTFTAPGHAPLRQTLRVSFPHRPAIYNLPKPGYPLPKPHGHRHSRRHPTPRRRGRHG